MERKIRMNAYYYAFTPTGVPEIDIILSAVACAGKAFHHTDRWSEDVEPYEDVHKGGCPIAWIQNAANEAACAFAVLRAAAISKDAAAVPDSVETPSKPDEARSK